MRNKAVIKPHAVEIYTDNKRVSILRFVGKKVWNKGFPSKPFDYKKCNAQLVAIGFACVERANREGKDYLELYPKEN